MDFTILFVILGFIIIEEVTYFTYHFYKKQKQVIYKNAKWDSKEISELTTDEITFIKQEAKKMKMFTIDDITWNDLDMDLLYQHISICLTSAGDQTLYSMLRTPLQNQQDVLQREQLILKILENEEQRNLLRSALLEVNNEERTPIDALYASKGAIMNIPPFVFYLLSGLVIIPLLACIMNPSYFGFVILMCIVNYIIAQQIHKKSVHSYVSALQLYQYARSIHMLAKSNLHPLFEENFEIKKCANKLKKIRRSYFVDFYSGDGFLLLLLGNSFLFSAISYQRLSRHLLQYRSAVEKSVIICGEIDALISVAAFQNNNTTCEVTFTKEQHLLAKDMVHPLLKNPVSNDVDLKQHILISGSNASGKSTYLKMIALNSILAQNFGFAFAKSYEGGFFHIYTSMSIEDHIDKNDSYFMAEIKSIKRILDALDRGEAVLCMIDEILRGTNTGERIAAASEILMQFVKTNSICLSATHDIELSRILQNYYHNIHFCEMYEKQEMKFTYKVQEGPANSQNAILLLETLGFDSTVINEAREQMNTYQATGEWMAIKDSEVMDHV